MRAPRRAVRRVAVGLALLAALVAGCAAPPSAIPAERASGLLPTVGVAGTFTVETVDRGAYGLPVALVFLDAGGAPLGAAARDTLDEAGRFSMTAARPDGAAAAIVIGETRMAALRLVPSPPGGMRLGGQATLPLETAIRVPLPAVGGATARTLAAELPREYGIPVRMLTLSREYVLALYGGELPFPLPPVQVELSDKGGYVFQPIDPDSGGRAEIEVNTTRRGFTRSTLAHEYGHYVSYRMWGSSPWRYSLRNRDLREGWAVFFSFAARAYAAATYGEDGLQVSNPERAAFTDLVDGPDRRRYRGIAYGRTRPRRAATGALLWNLYDSADASPFEPGGDLTQTALPGPGDNDDLALGVAVFEATRATRASVLDEAGLPEILRELKTRVSSEQAASIDAAAAFFLCPALVGCDVLATYGSGPTAPTQTLPPVSPADLRVARSADGVRLTWTRRTVGGVWANAPTAYRISRDGVAVAEVSGTASAALVSGDADGVWSVTAVGVDGVVASDAPTAVVR